MQGVQVTRAAMSKIEREAAMLVARNTAACDIESLATLRQPIPWIGDPGKALAEAIDYICGSDSDDAEAVMVARLQVVRG